MVAARSETRPLPHNLITLQDSLTALHSALVRPHPLPRPLDPTSLLALRVHCVCSEDGTVYVQCECVQCECVQCECAVRVECVSSVQED